MNMLLLIIPLVFSVLSISCEHTSELGGSQTVSNIDVKNTANRVTNANQRNLIDNQSNNSDKSSKLDYLGCWIGERGGGLRIDRTSITHYDTKGGHSFLYSVKPVENETVTRTDLLFELDRKEDLQFLKKFVSIKYEGSDELTKSNKILVFGYDSYDAYLANDFGSSGRFYAVDCEKDLHVPQP